MPIERDLWKEWLPFAWGWLCPKCQRGHYRPVPQKFVDEKSARAKQHQATDEYWGDPEMVENRYASILQCDNRVCAETAMVCGDKGGRLGLDQNNEPTTLDVFRIRFVHPAPIPFMLGSRVPEELCNLIQTASSLYWSDREACVNKLRQAVEALLTHQGVSLYTFITKSQKQKRTRLDLHARIDRYAKKFPDRASLLFALKWIGNAGSHVGELSRKDVMSSFEILEVVLEEIFEGSHARAKALAKKINEARGPISRVKRKRAGR